MLKNRFLDRLDTFIDDDLTETNPELPWLTVFIDDDLSRWTWHSSETQVLLNTYPELLTPRTLLEKPPLDAFNAKNKRWIGDIADALWRARHNVEQDLNDAQDALDEVNSIYHTLASDLEKIESVADLKRLRPTFQSLRGAGYDLVSALGNFCREVRAT
jgi:hypothetical protein